MFFWTQFGALFLLFVLLYVFFISQTSQFSRLSHLSYTTFEVNYFFVCLLIGFGVKLPIWPFYGWLPKAHVEASTNFSIFLSGVLVKFAFFGLFKCLLTFQVEPTFIYVYPFLLIGMVDAIFKLFYQIDLKKLDKEVKEYISIIKQISSQTDYLIVNSWTLPGNVKGKYLNDYTDDMGLSRNINLINIKISNEIKKQKNIIYLNTDFWIKNYNFNYNPKLWYAAKIPFSQKVFDIASSELIKIIKAFEGKNKKLIIKNCSIL